MKFLLDTHAFLWMQDQPEMLSEQVNKVLADNANQVFLSLASLWEIQIKLSLGKLSVSKPLSEVVIQQTTANSLRLLEITPEHIYALEGLPAHHRDPFDRLLLAQAMVEKATFVTKDAIMSNYDIPLLW